MIVIRTKIAVITAKIITAHFMYGTLQNIIKQNPCDALEIKKHTANKRHALTVKNQEDFLQAIVGQKYQALCVLLLQTGLRIGEALALTVKDIDTTNQTLNVSKNVVFINGKRVLQDTPKTDAGIRTIPIPPLAYSLLPLEADSNQFLFDYTYNSVRLFFVRLSKTLGFTVTPHILRHTYATRLEESGISPKVAQYLMGHATLAMTKNVYTDIQEDYIARLSNLIKGLF